MKISFIFILAIITNMNLFGQAKVISQEWTAFSQSVDASFLKKKVKFRVTAFAKMITSDSNSTTDIFVQVGNKKGDAPHTQYRKILSNDWQQYTVEGTLDETSSKVTMGAWFMGAGKFFFDNFELYVENSKGEFQKVPIDNPSFETSVENNTISHWAEGMNPTTPIRVKLFTFSTSDDKAHGNRSLLIEGTAVAEDTSYVIGPLKGFTPQIGTLVSMLNNLSSRVEQAVQLLNPKELDYMMDDKANTIGALVMHLAAAEAYFQVRTFENRGFNDEEKQKWAVALDLGEEGRIQLTGHDIDYYLNIYKEVRKKTIEELAKRNDEWLTQSPSNYGRNNHFCWFHVMEHQANHLGQIRLMMKRLPERKEAVKVNMDH